VQVGRESRPYCVLLLGRLSKNGATRRVPMNSVARTALVEAAARRQRTDNPGEPVFTAAYRTTARALERAVGAAQASLAAAGKDASRLQGYTWHGNRHSFASPLVMAGSICERCRSWEGGRP
jgi:site-specific recombinase XerC